MEEYTHFLVHHGVKGMHWGIRRYQNKDGSLTSAGRDKYGIKEKRRKKKEQKLKERAKKKAAKKLMRERAARDRRMKTAPGAASEAVKMDEKDIKDLINRYQNANAYMKERSTLDQYIDKVSPPEKSKGEKIVDAFSKAASVADSVSKIKGAYDKVFGNPSESEKLDILAKKSKLETEKQNRYIAMNNFLSKQKTESQNRAIARGNFESKQETERLARRMSAININSTIRDNEEKIRATKAKEQTMNYVSNLSDIDLEKATDRFRRENEALDYLFKYNKH